MSHRSLGRLVALLACCAALVGQPAPLAAQGGPSSADLGRTLSAALDTIQARIDAQDNDGARRAYDAFEGTWETNETSVRNRSRSAYTAIEDAMATLRAALYQGSGDATAALRALRGQIDAYAGGGSPPPAAAVAAAAPSGAPAPRPTQADSPLVLTRKTTPLGDVLADRDGRTVYVFTDDDAAVTGRQTGLTCVEDCADDWPPLEFNSTRRPIVGEGLDQALVSTVRRDGRTQQVAYAGRPLYYWGGDYAASELRGQGVGGNWYAMSPRGEVIRAVEGIPQATFPQTPPTTLSVAQTALGPVLADGGGQSVYMFKDDSKTNYRQSTCTSVECTGDWPPLLLAGGQPTVGTGLDASRVGTIPRDDGSLQVTYAGFPLYRWAGDFNPGDVRGQLVGPPEEGGDWFLLTPAAERITAPDPAWLEASLPDSVRAHRAGR
ncbi:MAG TPA: hypothetical protein VII06_01395 [Chloroflexota bacterium]|jgi:predicted lipoprotein with Yx(FWY)xxD motif